MRSIVWLATILIFATGAEAQPVKRMGAADSPIASSVEIAANSRIVYISGQVPDPVDPAAPAGSAARFGDTATQTRSVLAKVEAQLKQHGMGLGDIVMMRVFLVAPPGGLRMDFAGMMTAFREKFGTAEQPLKPARSTMEVSGPGRSWLAGRDRGDRGAEVGFYGGQGDGTDAARSVGAAGRGRRRERGLSRHGSDGPVPCHPGACGEFRASARIGERQDRRNSRGRDCRAGVGL